NFAPNVNGQSFGALDSVNISQQSVIDVSGNGGGTVLIRGGQFVLDNSTISANVTGPGPVINGAESIGGGIDIVVSQDAVIQNGAVLETNILGNATPGVTYGGVHVKADRIEIIGSQDFDNFPFTGITSDIAPRSTGGNSGNIVLEANSIQVQDFGLFNEGIESITRGAGNTGNISLTATGDMSFDSLGVATISTTTGNAGNITVTSTHGNISAFDFPSIISQSLKNVNAGNVGNITLSAPVGDIVLTDASVGTKIASAPPGAAPGHGVVQVTAKNLTLVDTVIGIDNNSGVQSGTLN